MSKKCELTGKIPMKGHNVSHANNKTKRRFLPNLKKVKFTSELMKRSLIVEFVIGMGYTRGKKLKFVLDMRS